METFLHWHEYQISKVAQNDATSLTRRANACKLLVETATETFFLREASKLMIMVLA